MALGRGFGMTDAFDYLESRDDADELIQEFGATGAVRRTTSTGTAWAPDQAFADFATFIAVVDYNDRQIDGENILRTDRRALVAAGPLDALGVQSIAAPDQIVIGGVAVPVVRVKPLNPAGTVVLFDCQVRY